MFIKSIQKDWILEFKWLATSELNIVNFIIIFLQVEPMRG